MHDICWRKVHLESACCLSRDIQKPQMTLLEHSILRILVAVCYAPELSQTAQMSSTLQVILALLQGAFNAKLTLQGQIRMRNDQSRPSHDLS